MTPSEMFALAYSEYPRHVARKAAEKAWDKLEINEDSFAAILKAILMQKRTIWLGKDLQYVPHFSTWLNGERWEDEIEHEQSTESANERIARENREDAIKFDQQLFGASWNGPGPEGDD